MKTLLTKLLLFFSVAMVLLAVSSFTLRNHYQGYGIKGNQHPINSIVSDSIPKDSTALTIISLKVDKDAGIEHGIKLMGVNGRFKHRFRLYSNRLQSSFTYSEIKNALTEKITYPEKALKDGQCGQVRFNFKISNQGDIYDVKPNLKASNKVFIDQCQNLLEEVKVTPIFKNQRRAQKFNYSITLIFTQKKCSRKQRKHDVHRYMKHGTWIYKVEHVD